MNKETWKDFFAWLDQAKVAEIIASRDTAREHRKQTRDSDVRSDLRRMIRLMDGELVTRADLARLKKRG